MLTSQQSDILSLLTNFRCLRYLHIQQYMAAKHSSKKEHVARMLKQLCFMGKVSVAGEYVMLPGRRPDSNVIKAFDVLMSLTLGNSELLYPGTKPFTLMFTIKAENGEMSAMTWGVVIVQPYSENTICSHLQTIDRSLTVIFILSDMQQQDAINVPQRSYFAVQDEAGRYKFYKAADAANTEEV